MGSLAGLLAAGVLVLATPLPVHAALVVEAWSLPAVTAPSSQPDLVATPDGRWLLAWAEKRADGEHVLRFARTGPNGANEWDAPRTIATGKDWFVNWADTPHVLALEDGTLWAHWLRRNGSGTYDYGIALVRSHDGGESWSAPIRVEPKGAKNDYGFVSLWPQARDTLGIAWLDSRQKPSMATGGHAADAHGGHGDARMMLRAATFSANGTRVDEWPLDVSTCDCCTTGVAPTARGPVVVYRGRGDGEIRDTRLVRFENGRWTPPRDVHVDGWKFAGCPVNGPAVAARGDTVWVAWYTEADGAPSLRLARSGDSGDTFASPIALAEGEGVLGRAALAIDANHVWMAWLEERDGGRDGQQVWLARADARSGKVMVRQVVATLAARGRASGLPRLQVRAGAARLVWTDVVDGHTVLRGASVR